VVDSEVAIAAAGLGLEVMKPADPNHEATRACLAERTPDLFAVVAFGAILSPALLAVPRLGAINLHGSLLPRYRGASPVQRTLWDGCGATGVTTLWMDAGIDTGDLILQRWEPVLAEDDAGALASRLAKLGGPLLATSLMLAGEGRAPRQAQDRAAASYAGKLSKQDGAIAWDLDAEVIWNRQRAVTPWPGAVTRHGGRPLLVTRSRPLHRLAVDAAPGTLLEVGSHGLQVACRPGVLCLERVKPEARAEMAADDWARGVRLAAGQRLGEAGEGADS
jgi:methionyl-tRNA formyltransferase